jgi:DNA-binding NtrC family response regulator
VTERDPIPSPLGEPRPTAVTPGRVVVLDADPYAAAAVRSSLAGLGADCRVVASIDEALEQLRLVDSAVLLADAGGRERDMLALLQTIRTASPHTSIVATGADVKASAALEWMRSGATDVLLKPFSSVELAAAIARAQSRAALEARPAGSVALRSAPTALESMVGNDPRLGRALGLARAASSVRSTVLILGESGTGKSLLARSIHRASPRAQMPYVELACGSIPETLLESELFGHVKGAFTGAIADKKGRFAAANGGTLFLDEINSASPTMQLKLLRVLQERKFEPVGSDETIEVDVRVIVASNQPLERLVDEGKFRQDLYYRVNVLPIELPPLRERPSDIASLANHFLRMKSAELGRTILGLTDDAIAALQRYNWPGNVRELENAIERATILCDAAWLDASHLPERVRRQDASRPSAAIDAAPAPIPMNAVAPVPAANAQTLADAMRDPERAALLAALAANNWNRSKAAASLGINRTTLYRKMRELGLKPLGHVG